MPAAAVIHEWWALPAVIAREGCEDVVIEIQILYICNPLHYFKFKKLIIFTD